MHHGCGFLFTQNFPVEGEIGRYYATPNYISHSDTRKGLVNFVYHWVRKYMLGCKVSLVIRESHKRKGSLLDIGTGTGYFPNAMQRKGWQVSAVEKNEKARDFAKKQFGLDVLPDNQLREFKAGSFDVITLWHDEFKKALYALGETPLPHSIINRPVEPEDSDRFQSIFARSEGAVTAPTANLHFSRELMKRMEIKGIDFSFITLHAGLGNFRDIDVEDLTKHKTDSEQMVVAEEAVRIVNRAKDLRKQVCAVGTTVMRAIESTVSTDGHLKPYEGWTNKFIFPPYEFTVANAMKQIHL